jgi:hypothetical protein
MITPETTDNTFKTATDTTGAAPPVPIPDQGAFMQGAPSPTSFTLPGYTKEQQLQVAPPQFAWQPSQADLGQGQVQASGFAEMKLPFGALASRGQSIAEREQANKQAQQALKEKFDPYGGVGKAADPFQPAFGRYARNTLDTVMADIVAAFGGDEEEAIRRINTPGTQENQIYLQKARELDDIATVNRYEFQKYVALYADVMNNKLRVSPETEKALKRYLSAQDETGTPIRGVDPAEFRSTRQDLEAWLSLDQYMKEFMDKLPLQVQEVASELGRAEYIGGDRYALESEITKSFGPALEQAAEDYSAMSGGRVSKAEALQKFRSRFNDMRKASVTTWSRDTGGGGAGDGKGGLGKSFSATVSRPPKDLVGVKIDPLTNAEGAMSLDWPTISLFDISNKQGKTPSARPFIDEQGEPIQAHPLRIMDFGGTRYIIAKVAPLPREQAVRQGTSSGGMLPSKRRAQEAAAQQGGGDSMDSDTGVQEFTKLRDIAIPYNEYNAAVVESAFGLSQQKADELFSTKAGKSSAAPAAKAADPSEAEVKKAFPGAIKDSKHGWVAKGADGKWRKVTL